MNNKMNCEIVKDLLPSYIDKLTSEETTKAVTKHLDECESCRAIYRGMTSSEPPIAEQPQIDYLKKVRNSRRRIRNIAIIAGCAVLMLGIAAAVIAGYSNNKAKADAQTITELEETKEELQNQIELPTVLYDAETKALVITGTDRYDEIEIPDAAEEAKTLDVQDDEFHLSAYIPLLRNGDEPLKTYLPAYINRTDKSIRFVRSYLKENAKSTYPKDLSDKMVEISIRDDSRLAYRNMQDRILLNLNDFYWHREELYLLTLMQTDHIGWAQFGYAWYLGSCVNPYSELTNTTKIDPNDSSLPYYNLCLNAGIDFNQFTAADYRKMNDAISRICIERGLTGWGTAYESLPLSKTSLYAGKTGSIHQDVLMSVCSATSFIARLDDLYGFEAVSAFCFGQKTFDESFGTDFNTAFDAWQAWIIETYPMD